MPRKTTTGRPKPKTNVKVVANRSNDTGPLATLRTRTGVLFVAFACVVVGMVTLGWTRAATTTESLWADSSVPKTITASDSQSVEVGVRFKSKYSGEVRAIRFYKGPQNTGTHIGNLWSSDGRKLASVTFTHETVSGWQTATFAQPVVIAANTSYTASYFAPQGHYSVDQDYFRVAHSSGALTALRNNAQQGNGVYTYSSRSAFPRETYRSSNYWVDVVFSTKRFDPTPLPVAPTNLTASVSGKNVTLQWTDSVTASIAYYEINRDNIYIGNNETGAGYVDANLTAGKTYTYQVRAVDAAGQKSAWSNVANAIIAADTTGTTGGTDNGSGTGSSGGTTTPPPPAPTTTAGLTDPSALTDYTGASTINSGTVVLENKRFTGRLTINGGTVTIRNSSFNFTDYYHLMVNGGTVIVQNSEFDGMNTTTTADDLGIIGDNVTVQYSVFKHLVNAMRPGSNSLIEHNVISNPNNVYGPAHVDGIEIYGGSNITVRSNAINISGGMGETGCVNIATDFASINNVTVEDNDFTGGTYSLYVRLQGAGSAVTNIKVRNNRWHTPHIYGTQSIDPSSAIVEWTGNTFDGKPLAL